VRHLVGHIPIKMKLLIAPILLFLPQSLFGQLQADIKINLVDKDIAKFKIFADTISNKKNNISAYWDIERDIAKRFQEKIWIAEKSVPDKANPSISTVYTFRLNLITADNKILYYDFQERKSKKVNDRWVDYYITIDKYKNEKLYRSLEVEFLKAFDTKLNSADLFIDTIVFGQGCGDGIYDGDDPIEEAKYANPKEDYILNNYIKNKDRKAILSLIHSANTEKQLYGVKGLLELQKVGITLTQREIEIVKNVLGKSGTARTCSGCIYDRMEIGKIAKELN
jgi:hypothetical protein